MKKHISLFSLLMLVQWTHAQTTAVDWTLADCSSNTHHLYEYLDSQEVVVMEFSHGCASCTQAAGYLMDIKADYDISHPGKIHWFFMDYNGNDCSTVASSVSMYNFDAEFINCQTQKDDYYPSIFPMPAIVIAAGNYHTVIFQNLTWLNSDTLEIRNALDHFFVTIGIDEEISNRAKLYPNPVGDYLTIEVKDLTMVDAQCRITDMMGKEQPMKNTALGQSLVLEVSHLIPGNYFLEISGEGKVMRKMFVKN